MPRAGTAVVHPKMLETLRAVAEAAMTSTCKLLHPTSQTGKGPFNEESGTYPDAEPTLLGTVACRVQPGSRSAAGVVDVAGEETTIADYQVTVPISAPAVTVDDIVHILTSPDAQMVGRRFRITDVSYADFQAERHLTCQDNEG